jgi:hypothetical protein
MLQKFPEEISRLSLGELKQDRKEVEYEKGMYFSSK